MKNKSVIIIGAGIAGLSTGCYGLMNGYKTQIFEMHDKPGGLCTSWQRQGFIIEGCLDRLFGSLPGSGMYHLWQELGVIQGQVVVNLDQLWRYESADGRIFTLYCNIDRLEQHMKEVAPEDSGYITELTNSIRHLTKMNMPLDKPAELNTIYDKFKTTLQMAPFINDFHKWGGLNIQQLASKFKSPLLREGWQFWPGEFSAFSLMMTIAWLHKKEAGYIIGGSTAIAQAVEKRFSGLGGVSSYNSRVTGIIVENDRAVGIKLSGGREYRADYVISAADGHGTIFDMLEGKYVNEVIRNYYRELPIFTPLIYIGLGVNRSFPDFPQIISGTYMALEKPFKIGAQEHPNLHIRVLNYDATTAPSGKTLLIVRIASDYNYWHSLRADMERYNSEKMQIAHIVIDLLEKRFPGLASQVEMIDVATPATFERYTGNWQGSYEGWLLTPKNMRLNISKTLPGLDNFYMAGQWVSPGGGIPSGAITGRHVIQFICKRDGRKFTTTVPP